MFKIDFNDDYCDGLWDVVFSVGEWGWSGDEIFYRDCDEWGFDDFYGVKFIYCVGVLLFVCFYR